MNYKKQSIWTLIIISMTVFVMSCDDDEPIIEPVPYEVKVTFPGDFANKTIADVEVTLTSKLTSTTYTSMTNDDGLAGFDKVNPGEYNIAATLQMTGEEYEQFFRIPTKEEKVNFSGTLENVVINRDGSTSETIVLKTSKIGQLLFKQIYFAGSNIREAAIFRDQFFELYNNSNEVIYLDGLYFALVFGRAKSTKKAYTTSTGQYDWEQSDGQTAGDKSNSDYCYADHVFRIPGTGKQYPLKPGESSLIAGTAIDHKQPLTVITPRGEKIWKVKRPDLTVDLSKANFEVYLTPFILARKNTTKSGKIPLASDKDNPEVPDLEVAYHTNIKELILDMMGKDSFIIFRTDNLADFGRFPSPQAKKITSKTRKYIQIPNSVIIDAVETKNNNPVRVAPRRLDTSLDGGAIFVPKGQYSSQSIIRKTIRRLGEVRILQDTNNSENDFDVIDLPLPGGWHD